ncbi:Probable ABC transporter ATP-binding protein HI_0664 [Legionella bozemanae]|uniref:Multidrug resistance ABC transporter ATP-binding protein n=1 Tax=Legionella bozemanae TaxID=447 RepID=A0A0W0RQ55_LEGBO|nr:multidrug resistance ABC transporter ATP-binding protein [Legionella bozemanae]STO34561.1 Probable ABC transporter ATP-binding protein HI_0664 [Legionella bozemanae]
MRLYDVQNGKILIDEQDISIINKHSLCDNIAFIPQHPSLFHRTVYENILYGRIGASYEEVINASKKLMRMNLLSTYRKDMTLLLEKDGLNYPADNVKELRLQELF